MYRNVTRIIRQTAFRRGVTVIALAALVMLCLQLSPVPRIALADQPEPTEPPAKPLNLTAAVLGETIQLNWDPAPDQIVNSYTVFRRKVDNGESLFPHSIFKVSGPIHQWTDADVKDEVTYVYRVKAYNSKGSSERSNFARITMEMPPKPPTEAPTLSGEVTDDGIALSWTGVTDETVTGYQILRRRPEQGENTLLVYVEDTGSAATTFTDTDVEDDVVYAYRVKAKNEVGVGPRSNFVRILMEREEPTLPVEFVAIDQPNIIAGNPHSFRFAIATMQPDDEPTTTDYYINMRWSSPTNGDVTLCQDPHLVGTTNLNTVPETGFIFWNGHVQEKCRPGRYEFLVEIVTAGSGETVNGTIEFMVTHPNVGFRSSTVEKIQEGTEATIAFGISGLLTDQDPDTVDYTINTEWTPKSPDADVTICQDATLTGTTTLYTVPRDGKAFQKGSVRPTCRQGRYEIVVTTKDANRDTLNVESIPFEVKHGPTLFLSSAPVAITEGDEATLVFTVLGLVTDSDSSTHDYTITFDWRTVSGSADVNLCRDSTWINDIQLNTVTSDGSVSRSGTIKDTCKPGSYEVMITTKRAGRAVLDSSTINFKVMAKPAEEAQATEDPPAPPPDDQTEERPPHRRLLYASVISPRNHGNRHGELRLWVHSTVLRRRRVHPRLHHQNRMDSQGRRNRRRPMPWRSRRRTTVEAHLPTLHGKGAGLRPVLVTAQQRPVRRQRNSPRDMPRRCL